MSTFSASTTPIILPCIFFLLYFLGQSDPTPTEDQGLLQGNNNNVDNEIIKYVYLFVCLFDGA
jgi:hypothetical protein